MNERQRREQAVITAAVRLNDSLIDNCSTWEERGALNDAVKALRALPLGPTGGTKTRRGAPCTSEMAAAYMNGAKARDLSATVLRLLAIHHDGLTTDQLVAETRRVHQSVSARVNELRDNGWIVDSGRTRLTRSGQPAIIWLLSSQALQRLSEVGRAL